MQPWAVKIIAIQILILSFAALPARSRGETLCDLPRDLDGDGLQGFFGINPDPIRVDVSGIKRIENCIVFQIDVSGRYSLCFLSLDGKYYSTIPIGYDEAVVAPDGTKILGTVGNAYVGGIYVAEIDGSGSNLLTPEDKYLYAQPVFSPDGGKIAYSERGTIYIMDVNDYNERHPTTDGCSNWHPSFSRDGEKIAFESLRVGNDFEIFTVYSDGSNITQITHNDVEDIDPVISPGGNKIAFVSGPCIEGTIANAGIYIMNIDGTNRKRLTSDNSTSYQPSFSPDGEKIVFRKMPSEDWKEPPGVFIMDIDGSNEKRLTAIHGFHPGFTPLRSDGVLRDTYGHPIED